MNSEALTKGEKETLLTRLYEDLEGLKSLFSLLVTKTLRSLKDQNIDCVRLQALIKSYIMPKTKMFSKKKTLDNLFLKLCDYWSFFDYELLALIISAYCVELEEDKIKYIAAFEAYCDRKVSEAPTKFKSKTSGAHYIIRVRIGRNFDCLTLVELKKLQNKLRKVTKMDLTLLRVEEGSIVAVFELLDEEENITPLSKNERSELFQMGVLKLYSDDHVYFDYKEYFIQPLPQQLYDDVVQGSRTLSSRDSRLPEVQSGRMSSSPESKSKLHVAT